MDDVLGHFSPHGALVAYKVAQFTVMMLAR